MNRCLGCRSKGSEWCENCDLTYRMAKLELEQIMTFLGEGEDEGSMALSAYEIMESERLLGQTNLGKAVIMARASELLAEVEDFFLHTPMCPKCRVHKMELQIGEPLVAGCTGGCFLG